MNFSESFLTALDSILANKMRAILTMLGVIIGVASISALLVLGNGFSEQVNGELSSNGTNLLDIYTNYDYSYGYNTLTLEDVNALADPLNTPDLTEVSAIIEGQYEVVYGGKSINTTISGITGNYLTMRNLDKFEAGDGLTENDIDTKARVAVLGATTAYDLFEGFFPIGESIKINGVNYEVVGILEGDSYLTDRALYIPITTAQGRLHTERTRNGKKIVSSITAQAAAPEVVDAAIEQIKDVLRDTHNIGYGYDDDFMIYDQSSLLEMVNTITTAITGFLGSIAAISLVVGGIGIMNIMLVSVTERTREIGIRKAVGALRRDILAQFLLESLVLSLLGGGIGITLGWIISTLAGKALEIPTAMEFSTIMLPFSFATLVGLIFGIYPAWRASNLRPIEALRYE